MKNREAIVPKLMQGWLSLFQKTCKENAANKEAALTAYVHLHISFVRIHPFWDGNGRTARLLMNLELMKDGYPPVVLPVEKRLEYYEALDMAHVKGDYSLFLSLMAGISEDSFKPYWHALGVR